MKFDQWQEEVQKIASQEIYLNDLWDADDPYEIFADARHAFAAKISPRTFFHDIFAEDISNIEYNEHLEEEAEEYDDEEE